MKNQKKPVSFLIKLAGLGFCGLSIVCAGESRVLDGAPARKPNVLLIMADDMGYSDAGCYGGEIATPNLDTLAGDGLRFTQHYSTGRCWPSRACVLSGYYAQQIRRDTFGAGKIGDRPPWAPLLPERLKPLGYQSYHSGKWHIDGHPKAAGFDRSWGNEKSGGCDENRYFSSEPWKEDGLEAPVKKGEPYYSTIAIADHAIACLKLHKKNHAAAPFFQYVAFYSPHFPLQAMKGDIDQYGAKYLQGWDEVRARRMELLRKMGVLDCGLSRREETIIPGWNLKGDQLKSRIGLGEVGNAVAWDALSEEQKRFQAGKMAIHAAMITRMDAEIGRIIKQLKDMGEFENTLIMFASDNGASAEQIIRGDGNNTNAPSGSAKSFLCLGPGWSTAANTPFRFHKHWNHEGGISSPFIVHWPVGFKARGALRHVPSHFIDIVPTVLVLAGGQQPETWKGSPAPALPGKSLLPIFGDDRDLDRGALWWCHEGNQAIRMGDWKLSLRKGAGWELYNLKADRSEMNNLADEYPDRVKTLAGRWETMAAEFKK